MINPRFILYMSMTVNGYIATKDGDTPWSDAIWNEYYDLVKRYKGIILGRKTYELMVEAGEFEKIGNPLAIVVSSKKASGISNTFFVSNLEEALKVARNNKLEEIIVGGGSVLNGSMLEAGLIDEIFIDIDPLVFGDGLPMFAPNDMQLKKLKLLNTTMLSKNTIRLNYKVLENNCPGNVG